jgi:hypothetical protein
MHCACGVMDTPCIIQFSNNIKKWKLYAKRLCYAKYKLKRHAVSMTPHAHSIHGACRVSATACTMHASTFTLHAHCALHSACGVVYTAWKVLNCMHNQRMLHEPWHPLKGISIKNIFVCKLSYPTTTNYMHLMGLYNKQLFSCMWGHLHRKKHKNRRLKIRISLRID